MSYARVPQRGLQRPQVARPSGARCQVFSRNRPLDSTTLLQKPERHERVNLARLHDLLYADVLIGLVGEEEAPRSKGGNRRNPGEVPVRAIGESRHGVGWDVASQHFTRRPARGLDDRVVERYRAGRSPRQLRDPLSGHLKVGIFTPQPFEKTFDVGLETL